MKGQIHPRALAVALFFQFCFTKILKPCDPSCIICETQLLLQNNITEEALCGWKKKNLQGTLKDDLSCQNTANGKQFCTKKYQSITYWTVFSLETAIFHIQKNLRS